jgi:hypothetical protein
LGSAAELPFMFNFQFGKKKPDKKQIIIVSIVLSSIIAALSQCTGVSENGLWDLLDEIQRKYFPQTILNEIFIQDSNKVERRVKRDVDRAVDDYWQQSGLKKAEVYKPRYIEEENDETLCYSEECKSLAPPMRLCAPWLDNCPKQ